MKINEKKNAKNLSNKHFGCAKNINLIPIVRKKNAATCKT